MSKFTGAGSALTIATALFGTASAIAQETPVEDQADNGVAQVDTLIVTARKKEETVQEAPLAISAVSGRQLQEAGIDEFSEVLATIPNASISGGIGGDLQGLVSIRGISTLVRYVGLETGVGYYVDGVYVGRPENFNQELFDIDRVEVLRGPQGAVFGKDTIAGAINIITQTPGDQTEGAFEAQYGNYNHTRLRAKVSSPIVEDTLSGSLSASYFSRDGFVENTGGTGPDLDTADVLSARGKLVFTPTDGAQFVLSVDGLRDRGEPAFFEVADVAFIDDPSEGTPFTVNQDQPNFLDRDIWGASLTSTIDVGGGEWTTILATRDSSFDAALDDDKLPFRYFVDFFGSDVTTSSLETRFAKTVGSRFDYVAGLYYFDQSADNESNFALGDFLTGVPGVEPPIDLISSVDTTSYALFFNTNTNLTDALTLEVGGRYVSEEKDAIHVQNDQTGLFGSTDFSRNRTDEDFSPTVSLSYDFSPTVIGYARYAEGFKSAGFNTDFIGADPETGDALGNLEVDPEKARSYELGLKSEVFDRRLRLNLAGFFTDYEDLQLSQIAGAGVSLNNAAEAEIYGIEADFFAALSSSFDLFGSVGWLDATYSDFPGCPVAGANTEPVTENCSGNFLNLAPEFTTALGGQFTTPVGPNLDFVARADWNYRSEVFFEPQNTDRLSGDARSLVNLRAGLVTDSWEVFGWANNVFDETYVTFADDRSAIFVNQTVAFGAPQTYGVTLRLNY